MFPFFKSAQLCKNLESEDISVLKGKIIGIYCGSHGSDQGRDFIPKLKKFRDFLESKNVPFEIVFKSFDGKEKMAKDIMENHRDWYHFREGDYISSYFINKSSVNSFPALLIVGPNAVKLKGCRMADVQKSTNPMRTFEKWRRDYCELVSLDMYRILGCAKLHKNRMRTDTSVLRGKTYGIYLDAHDNDFTAQLKNFQDTLLKKGESFEIVNAFFETDKREQEDTTYSDWHDLGFEESVVKELVSKYDVTGSTLFIVGPCGLVLHGNRADDVRDSDDPIETFDEWMSLLTKMTRSSD